MLPRSSLRRHSTNIAQSTSTLDGMFLSIRLCINANAGARGDSLEAVSYSCRWCCRGVLVRAYARGVLRFGRSMSGYGFSKRPASREDNQRHPLQCPTHNKPRTSPPCVSGTLSLGPSARLALHRNSSPEVRLEYRWSSPNHREMAPATLEPSVTQEVGSLGGVRWIGANSIHRLLPSSHRHVSL